MPAGSFGSTAAPVTNGVNNANAGAVNGGSTGPA